MNGLDFPGFVGQHQVVDLAVFSHGNKEGHVCLQTVFGAVEGGVTHAVAAFISVQLRFRGEEPGVPCFFACLLNIIEAAALVAGHCIIPVAKNALQLGIPIEAVAAGRVGNHAKEIFAAQVIDPGQGGSRGGNDIFPPGIIKISKSHDLHSFSLSVPISRYYID